MNNKMITIPYADAIEYGENTSALFKALWELTDLIRLESDLKKHHRAYLHVREDIDEKVKEARQIMTKVSVDMIGFYFKVDVPKCSNSDENTPFVDAGDDETVSIPKDKYELMIDDLLTMSEIIQCVADMRTQDVKAIREFGKFVPAFAAFEKNRLSRRFARNPQLHFRQQKETLPRRRLMHHRLYLLHWYHQQSQSIPR
jgi:hypothetical protein